MEAGVMSSQSDVDLDFAPGAASETNGFIPLLSNAGSAPTAPWLAGFT
jgi:hypothetical protein